MNTNSRPKLTAALSNYITQVVNKSSLTDFQEIFRIIFLTIPEDCYVTSHTISQ